MATRLGRAAKMLLRTGCAGLVALCATGPVLAFEGGGASIFLDLPAPNAATNSFSPKCMGLVFSRNASTRIRFHQDTQTLVGGGYWVANSDTIISTTPATEGDLELCGYTNPVIISQDGPSGPTFAQDDYIGIVWRASELDGNEVYQYEFAITGATTTLAINSKTLIGTRPTAAISTSDTALAAGETATITFTFSQSVTVANASAVTATGGTLGPISGSGTSYSATFTPTVSPSATAVIKIGNGAFTAGTGLTNQDAADADNSVSIAVDMVAPSVTLTDFIVETGGPRPGWYGTTITLSESSPNFTYTDMQLSSNVTNWALDVSSAPVYRLYANPPADNSTVTLSVPAGIFTDIAGNPNTASREISITPDSTPPTASIAAFTGPLNGAQTAVITLSEDSTDFVLADLTLTNATATLTGSGSSYTAVLTPIADGPVALSVGVGTFSDAAGNLNTAASNEVTTTFDGTPPTVTIAPFTGPLNGAKTAVITLSEDSTDFVLADLTLTNANATLTGSGSSYTAVLTPIADGPVALSVGVGTFSDAAGNLNTAASNEVTTTFDGTPPTVTIAPFTGPLNGAKTAVITLSEDSTDFVLADLTLTNATATLSGSGSSYTAVLTPVADGTVALSVGVGTFSDAAGNLNTAASNEVTTSFDNTPPTASIAAFTGPLNGAQTAVITLSEVSTDFVLADLTLTNATATLTGSGSSYTAVLTPIADGPVALSVGVGTFSDAAGNLNTAASNEVTTTFDSTPPTVSIAAFTGPLNGAQTAVITLSEDSTDFVLADLTLTNATATLSGSGSSYTAVLTPIADGPVALSVGVGTFSDAAGNLNTVASNEVTTTFDGTAPTVSIAAFTGPLNGAKTAVITLSEDSTDFVLADLTLTNATATLSGSGSSYTAVLTPVADGTVALSVGVGTFSDAAGNLNTAASNEVTTTFDGTAPTVQLSTLATSVTGSAPVDIDVVFSEPVTGFDATDLVVTNGSASAVTGSGAVYVATIIPTGAGDTDVTLPAASARDAAGNDNTASNTLVVSNTIVADTQEVIAKFMQTRANLLVNSQPGLTGFLTGGQGGFFNAGATDQNGFFSFASAPGGRGNLWVRLNGNWSKEKTSKSLYVIGTIGSHLTVTPDLLVGAMLEFDYLNQDDGLSSIEGRGWLAGPYVVAKMPDQPLFFEGRLLYGQTSNDVSPIGTYTDRFDTKRLLAMAKISGEMQYDRTKIMPSLQVSYTTDDQESYVDRFGNTIPGQGITLGQIELGVDFSHFFVWEENGRSIELTGGIAAIGSSVRGRGYASTVAPEYEGGRAKIKLGLNYRTKNGGSFFVDSEYDGIGAKNFESYGLRIGYDLDF